MPPTDLPDGTQWAACGANTSSDLASAGMPGVLTSSCLTAGLVWASLAVMTAVPMSTPSTGMSGRS